MHAGDNNVNQKGRRRGHGSTGNVAIGGNGGNGGSGNGNNANGGSGNSGDNSGNGGIARGNNGNGGNGGNAIGGEFTWTTSTYVHLLEFTWTTFTYVHLGEAKKTAAAAALAQHMALSSQSHHTSTKVQGLYWYRSVPHHCLQPSIIPCACLVAQCAPRLVGQS